MQDRSEAMRLTSRSSLSSVGSVRSLRHCRLMFVRLGSASR